MLKIQINIVANVKNVENLIEKQIMKKIKCRIAIVQQYFNFKIRNYVTLNLYRNIRIRFLNQEHIVTILQPLVVLIIILSRQIHIILQLGLLLTNNNNITNLHA